MITRRVARGRRSGVSVTWVVRVAISAAILVAIFRIVPFDVVWSQAQRLPATLWGAALAVFLVGHAAAAAKWRLLIGRGVSFTAAFQAHLAGLAANLCLPGLAGGDVIRAGLVFRSARDPSQLVVGSIADRLLDILGLLVFAALGALLLWRPEYGAAGNVGWFLAASVATLGIAMAAAAAVSIQLDRALKRTRREWLPWRWAAHVFAVTAHLVRQPGRLLLCLAISMIVQTTFIAINIAFASAIGVIAPTAAWYFAWCTAKIVAIAPISLGGLGLREAALARLLAPYGADPAQVIAIGLLWQTVLYASGVIGALALLVWKPDRSEAAAPHAARDPVESSP